MDKDTDIFKAVILVSFLILSVLTGYYVTQPDIPYQDNTDNTKECNSQLEEALNQTSQNVTGDFQEVQCHLDPVVTYGSIYTEEIDYLKDLGWENVE